MSFPLLCCSHLAMYQALLYLKTNQPVCLFTHSKGIKIGPSYPELRGVSKCPLAMNNPVVSLSYALHSPLHLKCEILLIQAIFKDLFPVVASKCCAVTCSLSRVFTPPSKFIFLALSLGRGFLQAASRWAVSCTYGVTWSDKCCLSA